MSRIADYVKTLTPAERARFADLIEECAAREAQIAATTCNAAVALAAFEAREREFWRGVRDLEEVSARLRDTVGRLYLATVPAKGRVS